MLRVFVIPKYKKHVSKGRGAGRQEGEGDVNKTTPIEHEMNKTLSTGPEYKYE